MKARIKLLDVETAPSLGWVWGKWEQNVIDMKNDWYMLSYAVKDLGTGKIRTYCLPDYPGYKDDIENDRELIKQLWKELDEADVVIAHNGDSFDIKKTNTRFLVHGLPPPSPYKSVDSLKVARSVFKFDSNKLDDLCRCLGIGRKLPHTGFHLWRGCMTGDKKSWDMMRKYNAHDIELLEEFYLKIRAWVKNHPNVNLGEDQTCPKCGSNKVQRRGFSYSRLKKKQRYQCVKCTGWYEGPAPKA